MECYDLEFEHVLEEPLDGSFLEVSQTEEITTSTPVKSEAYGNHECGTCAKTFKYKSTLTRHVINQHSIKQLHKCWHCIRSFDSKHGLKEHVDLQHPAKHLCVKCGQRFIYRSQLITHDVTRHKDACNNNTHVYMCPFESCDKRFASKPRYSHHVNNHLGVKPFSCVSCQKVFSSVYKRNEHELLCSGKKVCKCSDCDLQFKNTTSLRRHVDAQHNKIVHSCNDCDKTYAYHASLMRHRRIKHAVATITSESGKDSV